ncbi:MAG TPA: hypothetical protein VJL56_05210, partial [Candidatus Bathyarchaeia archaeon]|nr:hypothetical protein [Candidatus Bathyarchaeia archaeon]
LKVNVEADTAEMASLYRGIAHIGLFPGEVLFVKAFLTPKGLTPDNRTGGFMLGTSNFTCGDAGNYHADFRWLDGIAGFEYCQPTTRYLKHSGITCRRRKVAGFGPG